MGGAAVKAACAAGVVVAMLLAGCTASHSATPNGAAAPQAVPLPQAAAGPKEQVPSALRNMRDPAFPPPLIDPGEILSGGPPPDGIPAIDRPTFLHASDVTWIGGAEAVLVLTIGYTATIWGTAGLRQWIVVFLAFCVANQGSDATQGWSMLMTGALVGLLGVPAGLYGNELSLRLGLRATATGVFVASALANSLFGFVALLPYGVVVAPAMAAGFIVQGNFSNLTSSLLALAEPRQKGATVAVYSCIGFAGGFIGTLLFGLSLDCFGGTARLTNGLGGSIRNVRDRLPYWCHRIHIPFARSGGR